MWLYLGIAALILLIFFWKRQNAVWGGMTLGALIGLLIAIISAIGGNRFNFITLLKGIIVGVLLGSIFEILGRISTHYKKHI